MIPNYTPDQETDPVSLARILILRDLRKAMIEVNQAAERLVGEKISQKQQQIRQAHEHLLEKSGSKSQLAAPLSVAPASTAVQNPLSVNPQSVNPPSVNQPQSVNPPKSVGEVEAKSHGGGTDASSVLAQAVRVYLISKNQA
jgi:hypothetical protein